MDLEKFGIGLTSVAVLKLDVDLSLGKLKFLNKSAREANAENESLDYIGLNGLNSFIETNNDKMSLAARNAIRLLLLKKEYHHLNFP